jgi:hypothetical protein
MRCTQPGAGMGSTTGRVDAVTAGAASASTWAAYAVTAGVHGQRAV